MTKNGSNAHKARIRAHAAATGQTYRQAARSIEADDGRAQMIARMRAAAHAPDELVDIREVYVMEVFRSDLPDMVKTCLYALADRFGTGRMIDPYVAHCTMPELAEATGIQVDTVCVCVHLAEGLRWLTDFQDDETRMTIPGEDAEMYLHFLKEAKQPIENPAAYQGVQDRIAAAIADPEADRDAFYEEAVRRAGYESDAIPK